jgi:hypothetical protein
MQRMNDRQKMIATHGALLSENVRNWQSRISGT